MLVGAIVLTHTQAHTESIKSTVYYATRCTTS